MSPCACVCSFTSSFMSKTCQCGRYTYILRFENTSIDCFCSFLVVSCLRHPLLAHPRRPPLYPRSAPRPHLASHPPAASRLHFLDPPRPDERRGWRAAAPPTERAAVRGWGVLLPCPRCRDPVIKDGRRSSPQGGPAARVLRCPSCGGHMHAGHSVSG